MRVIKVEGTLDSGAEGIVAPPGVIPGPVEPSEMSSTGRGYRAANGSKIRNFGETNARFRTEDGHVCQLKFQIADLERVLIGATPLAQTGHHIVLGENGGEILHAASGRRIALKRRGGVYLLSMYFLVPEDSQPAGAAPAATFTRQGA